jgi:hypothetical protein
LNYICVALIYGDAIRTDETIVALLEQVRTGAISFDAAMDEFPPTKTDRGGIDG